MTDISIFTEKEHEPTQADLQAKLGPAANWWQEIRDFVFEQYPKANEEWNYPGKKYGWSFRVKDKKRAIIYLLPYEQTSKVALIFGQKAYDYIMTTNLPKEIKDELKAARKYAEGRGIKIPVAETNIEDIKELVKIKLMF